MELLVTPALPPFRYNFGCGLGKLPNYVNIDINPELKPDMVLDITKDLYRIPSASSSHIICAHTIEHVQKMFHFNIFSEFHRILVLGGQLYLAYPEFEKIARNWLDNKDGLREFWEATIYGRQNSVYDGHVALMDTIIVKDMLQGAGFTNIVTHPEKDQEFNTKVYAICGPSVIGHEEAIARFIGTPMPSV